MLSEMVSYQNLTRYPSHEELWLSACMCEGVISTETGVKGIYELPRGYWELNSGPLEKSVFQTAEPSLPPQDQK